MIQHPVRLGMLSGGNAEPASWGLAYSMQCRTWHDERSHGVTSWAVPDAAAAEMMVANRPAGEVSPRIARHGVQYARQQ